MPQIQLIEFLINLALLCLKQLPFSMETIKWKLLKFLNAPANFFCRCSRLANCARIIASQSRGACGVDLLTFLNKRSEFSKAKKLICSIFMEPKCLIGLRKVRRNILQKIQLHQFSSYFFLSKEHDFGML